MTKASQCASGVLFCALAFFSVFALVPSEAFAARDAAFMAPSVSQGSNMQGRGDEAIIVEPKSDVDLGETQMNVGRRATFFFVNQSNAPVEVETINANGDTNVKAEIVGDDCSREKKILAASRCSITVEVTPIGAGTWTSELLMTHKAAGRITRARVSGKTSGVAGDKRETGLSLNTKDFKPVDFGDVEVSNGKAVRTALMVNDSNEIISILSVEIIAADNGLQRLEQGCTPDMDLKMGESCPVTIVWKPEQKVNVSTDLIIRHTGRLGFAVIPVRGVAKENAAKIAEVKDSAGPVKTPSTSPKAPSSTKVPLSPTADELEKMIQNGKIPPISAETLPTGAMGSTDSGKSAAVGVSVDSFHLIGTVGNRAVIYKPDGSTAIVAIGEEIATDDGGALKILNIGAKEAEVSLGGKRKVLRLEAVTALTQKAADMKSAMPKTERMSGPRPSVSTSASVPLPSGGK